MTIGLILTIVFAVMDYTGQVDWEWWQVAMPAFIEIGLGLLWIAFVGNLVRKAL